MVIKNLFSEHDGLEIPKNISYRDGLNKGQKWYGPNRGRKY